MSSSSISKARTARSSKSLPYSKKNLKTNSYQQVSQFKSTYKQLSPVTQNLVDMIIDPDAVTTEERIPQYGMSATYKAHNIYQCKYDASGRSAVAVNARLRNSIYATYGGTFVATVIDPTRVLGQNPYAQQYFSLEPSDGFVPFTAPFYFSSSNAGLTRPFMNSQGDQVFLYPIGPTSAVQSDNADVRIGINLAPDFDAANLVSVRWTSYDSSLNIINQATVNASAAGGYVFDLWNDPVQGAYISIDIQANTMPYRGLITQFIRVDGPASPTPPGTCDMQLNNTAQHMQVYDVNGTEQIITGSERFVVTAQSCLLTYLGSELQNGGQLAIARIPGDSVLGENSGDLTGSSWYSYISNLSKNSYNGAIKDGGYAFYLGEDDRSYFYHPVSDLTFLQNPYIVAEWTSEGTPYQTVRIQVTTVVQFTTNNNVYSQAPSLYFGEEWCRLLHLLSIVNAAYDNSGHRAKLKAALRKIGSKVLSLLKDPKTYTTIGSIAASLL